MQIAQAQQDMREGYCDGAAGILASAIAWSVAAAVALYGSTQNAIWALLLGGMFIHPLGMLICRLLGARGSHSKGNPLGQLAGASTFWLIFCLPLAYALSLQHASWFFAAMLLIIGGRYLVFATLYGMHLYWALGLALAAAGFTLGCVSATAQVIAVVGAAVEAVFAGIFLFRYRRRGAP